MSTPQARSFGTAAERYDRYRPTYAPQAAVWALGTGPLRVADLGAGTGILSRVLRDLGHEVIAVEPDERMRARLVDASPGVTALSGTAEQIPLPDACVDAVVAGQAYHWFDGERAHAEIARVLRPGGVFAPMWNDADNEVPWTVRLRTIIDGPHGGHTRPLSDFGAAFGPVTEGEFHHDMWLSVDDLVAMATTRSPYLVGTDEERERMVAAIREMAAEHGLGERFPMPHITRVHRAVTSR